MDIWKTNEFEFEVGDTERHSSRITSTRPWAPSESGWTTAWSCASSSSSRYTPPAGTSSRNEERHNVAIEHSRKWVVGGRPTCTTFVDGLAVGTY